MKCNWNKILSAVLVVLMLLTIVISTSAAEVVVDPGAGFEPPTPPTTTPSPPPTTTPSPTPSTPTVPSGPTGYTVTFVDDTVYELTAQPGTTKNTDGDVLVGSVTGVIPEKKIPVLTTADEYYKMNDWAIMDKDGNLVPVDLETYKFTSNTKVYAMVEDVWPVYEDMLQDRTDWFYQYVRDLSIAGVVNGFPGYVFLPREDVTWAQALKLIMLATGYEVQEPTDDHWASGYLTAAREDALVPADLEVNLDEPITRMDIAEIAAKAMKLEEVSIETPFIDTDAMPVLELYVAGIVEGSFNEANQRQFLPDDNITRAEISTIIWRINNYTAEEAAD